MKGTITRRGMSSWRLKFDVGRAASGKRQIRYLTVRGKRRDAERELAKHLTAFHQGTSVEPSNITVTEYIRGWLDTADVSPKTLERYRQLAEQQIIPHLGAHTLQKLRPVHIQDWHTVLLKEGGKDGSALSPRTVGHAHRVLHRALARATTAEIISRNVASAIRPPKVTTTEVEILSAAEIGMVLTKLDGKPLYPIVTLALATGMRRGELLGLQWGDIDWNGNVLKVQTSVEETKNGLRLKPPKSKHGRRAISLPPSAMDMLRSYRLDQRKLRVALGLGREEADTFVFGTPTGQLRSPDNLSRDWVRAVKAHDLPKVMFHALRHSHASALIAAGVDVLKISRRLGHGSPVVTLTTYAHLFEKTDAAAASAIEATLSKGGK
ncbi:MAG: site-specific integrase [Terriglobia bacterium]|nr:site-specific integrase [Terriglobia bacterium]